MAAPTPAELLELVTQMATQPKRTKANGFEMEQQSIDALVRAAELLIGIVATEAQQQPHRGMRLTKLISPPTG